VNIYPGGRLTLFHLDLYRLDSPEQIIAAGLEEYLNPDGVTVIEWAERWFGAEHSPKSIVQSPESKVGEKGSPLVTRHSSPVTQLPQLRWVQIETLNETTRQIIYEDIGT
jgi:tRNA threonylcarbamoyladenosine biosynthesis protein TsaE